MYVRKGSLDAEEIRARSDGESAVMTMLRVRLKILGQTVKVVILKIDREKRKLSLGLKQLTASPWDEGAGGTVDLDEQRRAFEAFRRVWAASSVLDGIYVWNWYGFGGPTSISYTPRGKPAEAEVKRLLQDL